MASLLSKALCKTTGHKWIGCKCSRCGEIRDEGHAFLQIEGKCEQRCSVCDKHEMLPHQWNGIVCTRCGTVKGITDKLRVFSETRLSFLHLEKKKNRVLLGLSLFLVILFTSIGIMAKKGTNNARNEIPQLSTPTGSIQTEDNQTVNSNTENDNANTLMPPSSTPDSITSDNTIVNSTTPDNTIPEELTNTDENENPDGHIVNEEYTTLNGDWLFYSNMSDAGSLYRIRTDGTDNQKISDDECRNITVVGEWIYFSNESDNGKLYIIRSDGTGRRVFSEEITNDFIITGGWVFYIQESILYRVRTDGTDRQQIAQPCTSITEIVGEWIYYTNRRTGGRAYSVDLHRISTDGTNEMRIVNGGQMNELTYVIIIEDWIYCIDRRTRGTDSKTFYRIRTDGTGKTEFERDRENSHIIVGEFHVVDDWIYFKLGHYRRDEYRYSDIKLYRVRTDGTGREMIADEDISIVFFANGWIYYHSRVDGVGLHKMSMDGSVKQMVTNDDAIIIFINVTDEWIYYMNKSDNSNLNKTRTDGTDCQLVE